MFPDPTDHDAPGGSLPGVTVCGAVSLLVQITVLLTPIKTVTVAGE